MTYNHGIAMKKPLFIIIIIAIIVFFAVYLLFNDYAPSPDVVLINDAVMTVLNSGEIKESTQILAGQLMEAFEEMDDARRKRDRNLHLILIIFIIIMTAIGIWLYLYYESRILKPFIKLQAFARRIAEGNLDIPLLMDKDNLFGAFTESFDLMREELKTARENERLADRSKKELVASLSHDIKTPVASIKAVCELMLVMAEKEGREKDVKQLETISAKAEQINSLITDMFHATLEELEALTVTIAEIPSPDIINLVENADYGKRVRPFTVPKCLILSDLLRLQQVIDNIIGNSYKYAGTDIVIKAFYEENKLALEITDFGPGVPEDELPLILNKFYRGKNTGTKSGYGLGLFIAKYLMGQMGGEISCGNQEGGFTVKVSLNLAG